MSGFLGFIQESEFSQFVGHDSSPAGASFAAFAFEPETETIASAFSVAPTTARKRTIDRAIRRMKNTGIFTKATALYFIGANQDASLKNWKTPGTYDLTVVGGATHAADDGWTWSGVSGQYLNTNMNANVLSQDDCGHYVWCKTSVQNAGSRYGVINASSQGISMVTRSASTDQINARCAGTAANVTGASHSDGIGLSGVSRSNSANMIGSRNGVTKTTASVASAALPALPITLLSLNNNGTNGNGIAGEKMSFWYFGQALTEAEERHLTAIVGEYLDSVLHGEPIIEEVGIGTASISADCVAYGFTMESVCFALQAARQGKTAVIIGGWRDRHFGGMAGGGLGFTDYDTTSLGGLPRWVITRTNAIAGISDDSVANGIAVFKFQSKNLKRTLLEMLNPVLNGGYTINCYQSGGASSVQKTGAAIVSLTTADGRTVTGSQFYDGSYEKDLLRLSGATYYVGREAAGSGAEAAGGVEAIGNTVAMTDGIGGVINVDPWVTPGDEGSGLIFGVHKVSTTFQPGIHDFPAAGSADDGIPAYNFRLTMTDSALHRVPLPSSPPAGFDATRYELFLRWVDAAATAGNALGLEDIFKMDNLRSSSRYDVNNQGTAAMSTNHVGENHAYPLATYAQRETIWKDVWNHILGLWYVLQYHDDARINGTALRTAALTWGFCQDHYFSPHENDEVFHMPQMYVRESLRLVGSVIMDANHMNQTDGQTPTLGTNTISTASYDMDSHLIQRIAHETSSGVWTVKLEGGMLNAAGGANDITPLPYEIAVPQVAECNNLSVGFGMSTTHVSFGTTRMEFTAAQTGQSMGLAAALAIDSDNIIQNVDYATLRTALLASAELAGEVAPVLPQVT